MPSEPSASAMECGSAKSPKTIERRSRRKNKFHLRTHPENIYFSTFYDVHGVRKALPGGVLSKNSYLKVLPMNSLNRLDVFCTVSESNTIPIIEIMMM